MANSDSGKNSFEENIEQIDRIIKLNLGKWKLKIINSISPEDIAQELRIQVYRQWSKYDQTRPLGNWLTTVINNRLINLTRDNFYKFAKPCLNCPKFNGGNLCSLYGEISSECGIYRKWELEKKFQHDCTIPVTIEDHQNELYSMPSQDSNLEEQINHLKHRLEEILSPNDYKIFDLLYLQNKTENEVITILNYKTQRQGLSQINKLKKNIILSVKQLIVSDEMN